MDLGVCVRDIAARELAGLGRFAEDHGFTDVYVPDVANGGQLDPGGRLSGRDAFAGLAAMFSATTTVRGAVGVAAAIAHRPWALALTASTLQEQSAGRFALGVGVSHRELATRLGVPFPDAPVAYMRQWLDELRRLSGGGVAFGGGWPVLLGALGPRMLALGARAGDGVVLNWLTPEHAAASVRAVRDAAPPGASPITVLYVRLMADEAVRRDAAAYDAAANYHRHFLAQGLPDVDAIVRGTTVPVTDPGRARDRIAAYRDAGLDLLCLYPHGLDSTERERALALLAH
jgi:alkanesulfonate monooxygenase SsuD/methylene tetrahydromethanopterin reductase-like flavin-dependent oxidoreductase (luciferase family)